MTSRPRWTIERVMVAAFAAATLFNSYTLTRIERHTDQKMEVRIYPAKAAAKPPKVTHGPDYLPPADYAMAIPADWSLSLAPKGKKP